MFAPTHPNVVSDPGGLLAALQVVSLSSLYVFIGLEAVHSSE